MASTTLLVALCLLTTTANAVNPGFRVRLSQFGLNYMGSEALKALADQVKDTPIPDQSGEDHTDVGKIKWTLKNMKVTSFYESAPQISCTEGKSLNIAASNMALQVNGDFHYELKIHFIPIKDSGSFDVSMSQISAAVQVAFGLKPDGHLTMTMTSCTSDIGSAKVKFHGGAASIYNFFSDTISNYLKGVFNPEICKALSDVININGDRALASQKMNVSIGSNMMIDMTNLSPPLIGDSFIQTDIKGEVFWEPKRTPSPQVAPPLPAAADETKMVNIWLSAYVLNTLAQVTHDHGLINTTIDQSKLSDDKKYALNTTCPSKLCIGSVLTKLASVFPDSVVVIPISTMSVPYVNITQGNTAFTLNLRMQVDVILPNASSTHAFTMETVVIFNVQPAIIGSNVTAKIASASATAHELDSRIGNLTDAQLGKAISLLLDTAIIPSANAVLASTGIPLENNDITLANPRIVMEKDALVVNTDIIYKPKGGNAGKATDKQFNNILKGYLDKF